GARVEGLAASHRSDLREAGGPRSREVFRGPSVVGVASQSGLRSGAWRSDRADVLLDLDARPGSRRVVPEVQIPLPTNRVRVHATADLHAPAVALWLFNYNSEARESAVARPQRAAESARSDSNVR